MVLAGPGRDPRRSPLRVEEVGVTQPVDLRMVGVLVDDASAGGHQIEGFECVAAHGRLDGVPEPKYGIPEGLVARFQRDPKGLRINNLYNFLARGEIV